MYDKNNCENGSDYKKFKNYVNMILSVVRGDEITKSVYENNN